MRHQTLSAFPWSGSEIPAPQFIERNTRLRGYAKAHGYTYVDYHAALTTPQGGMKPGLSSDGVHPTPAGYAIMTPLALAAITKMLGPGR